MDKTFKTKRLSCPEIDDVFNVTDQATVLTCFVLETLFNVVFASLFHKCRLYF